MSNHFDHISDNMLIQQISESNEKAFQALYDRYASKLLAYCVQLVHELSEAEDILQEVFSSIWNRRSTLQIQENAVEYYLVKAIKNQTLKSFTRSQRKEIFLKDFLMYAQMIDNLNPIQSLSVKEINDLLMQKIESMPEKMKEIFLLSRQEQLSQSEIAEILGIQTSTVKKQIQNALKHLRKNWDYVFILFLLWNLLNTENNQNVSFKEPKWISIAQILNKEKS